MNAIRRCRTTTTTQHFCQVLMRLERLMVDFPLRPRSRFRANKLFRVYFELLLSTTIPTLTPPHPTPDTGTHAHTHTTQQNPSIWFLLMLHKQQASLLHAGGWRKITCVCASYSLTVRDLTTRCTFFFPALSYSVSVESPSLKR